MIDEKLEYKKEKEAFKSIFRIQMSGEERCYENTSGLGAEELCRAYAACTRPFVEMESYGGRIEAAEFAFLQQGETLLFSVEFDADKDEIVLSDGEQFEYRGLTETLFGQMGEKEREEILTEIMLQRQKENGGRLEEMKEEREEGKKGKKEYKERRSLKECLAKKKAQITGKRQEYKDHAKKKEQVKWEKE